MPSIRVLYPRIPNLHLRTNIRRNPAIDIVLVSYGMLVGQKGFIVENCKRFSIILHETVSFGHASRCYIHRHQHLLNHAVCSFFMTEYHPVLVFAPAIMHIIFVTIQSIYTNYKYSNSKVQRIKSFHCIL
jgi:hypothetical protein